MSRSEFSSNSNFQSSQIGHLLPSHSGIMTCYRGHQPRSPDRANSKSAIFPMKSVLLAAQKQPHISRKLNLELMVCNRLIWIFQVPSPCRATVGLSHTNSTSQVTAGINKCAFKFTMPRIWTHCAKWGRTWLKGYPIYRRGPNLLQFPDATWSYWRSSSLCGLPVRRQIKLYCSSCLLNQGRSLPDLDSSFTLTLRRHLDPYTPMSSQMKRFLLIRLTVCHNLRFRRSKTEGINRLFLSFPRKKWRKQNCIKYLSNKWT